VTIFQEDPTILRADLRSSEDPTILRADLRLSAVAATLEPVQSDKLAVPVRQVVSLRVIGRRLRIGLVRSVWLSCGLIVLGYAALVLYGWIARIEIDSAIVAGRIEAIKAPTSGKLSDSVLDQKTSFREGDILFSIRNPELEQSIALASIRLDRAKVILQRSEDEAYAERARRDTFVRSVETSLGQTKTDIARYEELERNAQSRLDAAMVLYRTRYAPKTRVEDASDKVAETHAQLVRARLEAVILEVQLEAAKSGSGFYGGNSLLGRLPEAEAGVRAAKEDIRLAEEELQVLLRRRSDGAVQANGPGQVLRVLRFNGANVREGDTIAVTGINNDRFIYAFLAQSEIGNVAMGDTADVFLPAQQVETKARVVSVERAGAYLDEVEYRFAWLPNRDITVRSASDDRTGRVTLRFLEGGQTAVARAIDLGTPVVVIFNRNWGAHLFANFQPLSSATARQ
jgi:multidrug resistance efflux pump